jgi:hypothetical protein
MTLRLSLLFLATLLFLVALATFSGQARAHTGDPAAPGEITASRILATGPLNIIVFTVSRR